MYVFVIVDAIPAVSCEFEYDYLLSGLVVSSLVKSTLMVL